jgi:flagellar biogenesis protein FliO
MSPALDHELQMGHAPSALDGGLAGWLISAVNRLREQSAANRGRAARRQMRLVETLSLGARRQLLLIECAGEKFLVGTGPESVQTITRLTSESATRADTKAMIV